MQKTLDLAIKNSEISVTGNGFVVENGKSYLAYMECESWDAFKKDMEKNYPDAFMEYGAGSGGEMKYNGKIPPKMASYGSSSRMIYNLSKEIPGFHFERKLPTRVGGIANLDGFLIKDDRYIFVEAKCREPYGEKTHLIESKYKDLYHYINAYEGCNLNIETDDAHPKMNVCFYVKDNMISYFDIKQMICHLLGIANWMLNVPTHKEISFLYLCYNPKYIVIPDEKKKNDIYSIYDKMCEECNSIDFKKLFEAVVVFLYENFNEGRKTDKEIKSVFSGFNFTLCDHKNYKEYIE